ncbi:MAG: hypothetical protein ABFD76_13365 [Smithella sp.]
MKKESVICCNDTDFSNRQRRCAEQGSKAFCCRRKKTPIAEKLFRAG